MRNAFNPFQFVVIAVAGWMNQKQQHAMDYLREENRVLREQLGSRRLRFTDDQRRRLAANSLWRNPPKIGDGSSDRGDGWSPQCGARNARKRCQKPLNVFSVRP